MNCQPSLRRRLWLGAVLLALLAIVAAGVGAWGLKRTQVHLAEATAAQRRLEAYAALSARISDWTLGWFAPAGLHLGAGLAAPDAAPIRAALDELDRLIAEDIAQGATKVEAAQRARASLSVAQLRKLFAQLDQTLRNASADTPEGQAALAFHAAEAPRIIMARTEADLRRREEALTAMEHLRRPLLWSALAIALTVPLVLLGIYLTVLRPLFRRLSHATAFAPALASGAMPPGTHGHDELGLMFARLRQVSARLDRRRAELEGMVEDRTAALSAANARLAQTDQRRRRFFADVGHELRTPLTVIMGEAELGRNHADPEVRASFQTIESRAIRLFRRIEDLLRIARSDSGQLDLATTRVDLTEVVLAAQADLAPVLKRAGLGVVVDLVPMQVQGDADWLRQVFAGLFENAAKYAGRGAVVTVCGHVEGQLARVRVSDTGPGLPEGMADKVFDRFTGSNMAGGFGVGLALARWVVETSGGKLQLAEGAAGLTLEMTLPLWEGA